MKTQIIQPLVKLRRVVYGMIALGCAYLLSFFIYPSLLPESTQATTGVAVEPYLEISPSNSVAFSVNPGTFNSASQTLSVRTTNYTGYKLTLSANASADLVGSRGTIPTITLPGNASSITSSGFTNGYGYSLNATDYKPVLTGVSLTIWTGQQSNLGKSDMRPGASRRTSCVNRFVTSMTSEPHCSHSTDMKILSTRTVSTVSLN